MSETGHTPELDELYRACKAIEDEDGGWNGGDVVDIVCQMLTRHGYDINARPEPTGRSETIDESAARFDDETFGLQDCDLAASD